MTAVQTETVLRVKKIRKEFTVSVGYFFSRQMGTIQAVDDLSFSVQKGETFGLVGESGCGKTTAGRIIAGLLSADGGSVLFEGRDILKEPLSSRSPLRKKIQMVFQDPLSSLNPRMTISDIVAEPLVVHEKLSRLEIREQVRAALNEVNLNEAFLDRYPHQLSGGQRQRVLIARALILSPRFIIADEPVSALDVSIQAQILNLLRDLQSRKEFSSLFISHDLAVVRYICHRTGVMYMGRLVESGPSGDLFQNPLHPYTKALKESSPDIRRREIGSAMAGTIPDPLNPPVGCAFHPRCPKAQKRCTLKKPEFREVSRGRIVACIDPG